MKHKNNKRRVGKKNAPSASSRKSDMRRNLTDVTGTFESYPKSEFQLPTENKSGFSSRNNSAGNVTTFARTVWHKLRQSLPAQKIASATRSLSRSAELSNGISDQNNRQLGFGNSSWNNPRVTGLIAAVLLLAMLATAAWSSVGSAKANDEPVELASAQPGTLKLAKEYIYAGSRMLAIEDYGLNATPTPATPTPTPATPTPTPPTPTPTPPTPTPTPALPDLVVSNFTLSPTTITSGDSLNYSVTVQNIGAGATPNQYISVTFLTDGSYDTFTGATMVLGTGQSTTYTGTFNPTNTVGSHTITAQVDDVNRIPESNENNNTATAGINVNNPPTPTPTPAKPDLVISSFTTSPSSPNENDAVDFSVVVTNQGAGTMSGFLGVKYEIDGVCPSGGCPSHAEGSITIAPNQSVTLTGSSTTWAAIYGSHTLTAIVDDVGAVDESDESNNTSNLNIFVFHPPCNPTQEDLNSCQFNGGYWDYGLCQCSFSEHKEKSKH